MCIANRRTTLHKKHQKSIQRLIQNPLKVVPGGLQNTPPKCMSKNNTKNVAKVVPRGVPGTPLLEAQNQKVADLRLQFGDRMVSQAFLVPKVVPRSPQDLKIVNKISKIIKNRSNIVAKNIKIRQNPSKSSQNFLFPQGLVKIAESKGRR